MRQSSLLSKKEHGNSAHGEIARWRKFASGWDWVESVRRQWIGNRLGSIWSLYADVDLGRRVRHGCRTSPIPIWNTQGGRRVFILLSSTLRILIRDLDSILLEDLFVGCEICSVPGKE